jgi:hypothetical protein
MQNVVHPAQSPRAEQASTLDLQDTQPNLDPGLTEIPSLLSEPNTGIMISNTQQNRHQVNLCVILQHSHHSSLQALFKPMLIACYL